MAPPPTSHPAPPPDPPFLQLQDELLEEIFHRLPAADHLACVSSACATFRRVITDHAFLRRYRTLHPPPLIGMHHKPFIFAQPRTPPPSPARAFADFDFSCSFLPSPAGRSWSKLDFFDGRALVADAPVENTSGKSFLVGSEVCNLEYQEFLVRDLAVCDPVHRRYVMLPAVPDGLKALVRRPDLLSLETFLAPGEDEENPLSFRVICLAHCRMNLLLLVFSSLDGQWEAFTCDRWSARATCASFVRSEPGLSNRRYANGCFYWHLHFLAKVLVFDARTMEFYVVDLPPEQDWPLEFVVVEATEGTLGILIAGADEDNGDDQCWLTYSILRNNKWHSEKVIPLPAKNASLLGVAGGYLLIEALYLYTTSPQEKPKCKYFSVDVKTLQVELFAALSKPIFSGLLYAGFPPSLCAPTL